MPAGPKATAVARLRVPRRGPGVKRQTTRRKETLPPLLQLHAPRVTVTARQSCRCDNPADTRSFGACRVRGFRVCRRAAACRARRG